MQAIRDAIVATLEPEQPMTVRQLYYALTVVGVIEKTEAEYKTVKRLTAEMRYSGDIPFEWFVDATRWMRKPQTFSSVESALQRTAATYRRALWDDASERPEVWVEKEALAGVLADVTYEWDVPLLPGRGHAGISALHSAAVAIKARHERGQRTVIYYFGDHDPSGLDIDRHIEQSLGQILAGLDHPALIGSFDDLTKELAFDSYCDFERIAVTEEQIEDWNLPTRPTKKTDTRSKSFKGESVDLDAIPPEELRRLARKVIEQHVDQHQLNVLRKVEAEEQIGLEAMAAAWAGDE
jgi:hypothetical protein